MNCKISLHLQENRSKMKLPDIIREIHFRPIILQMQA